jgi:hypothetical protein
MKTRCGRPILLEYQGSSMVFALLVLLSILTLGIAGLSAASFGLTLSNNYRTGIQAMQAAESGIVHALGVINANGGITTFGDASSSTGVYNWTTFSGWSTPTFTMPGYSNISYTITPSSDPNRDPGGTNSSMRMLLTSAGQAPGESQRTLKAHLGLIGPFTCGAVDLPSTGIDSTFNGNSFMVDGTDYDPTTGQPATNGMAPTLGISTRTQADADGIVTELGNAGIDNVVGMPVGPNLPSVGTCTGPSVDRVRNEIVPDILNLPCATASPSCLVTNPTLHGNDTFGTMASPQVTHYTGDLTIGQHGTMQGAGVLIVDGGLTINGDVDFTGLIIVRGTTQFDTDLSGHAVIYGSVWTTNLQLTVAGNAQALYSSQALSMVNNVLGQGQVLPQHATVLAWSE